MFLQQIALLHDATREKGVHINGNMSEGLRNRAHREKLVHWKGECTK